MTLDPKKIEQWAREADTHAHSELGTFASGSAWRRVRDAHFARLARADAFEMAAKEARTRAERCGGKAHPVSVGEAVSASIRALADHARRLERQRDEAREHSRKWCDDFTKLEPELRRMVEFAKQCQAERDEARADRDQFRVLWERDSRSLSDVIGQRNTARTVAEDNRARYVTAEHERDEALEALRELHEATLAPYPTFEQGAEAQNAWSERIDRARDRARAVIGGRK